MDSENTPEHHGRPDNDRLAFLGLSLLPTAIAVGLGLKLLVDISRSQYSEAVQTFAVFSGEVAISGALIWASTDPTEIHAENTRKIPEAGQQGLIPEIE